MNFDVTQRITGGLGIICLAYFVAHTVHLHNQAGKQNAGSTTSITQQKPTDKPALSTSPKGEQNPENKQPHAPPRRHQQPAPAKVLVSLSDGQRFVLMNRLASFRGNTVRLVLVGSEPRANIVFAQLEDIFEQAGWNRQAAEVGAVTATGINFPSATYLTGPNMSSELLGNVFSAFASVGIDVPMIPQAYMGPGSMGPAPEVVIVAH
jgi:hypothetical protein